MNFKLFLETEDWEKEDPIEFDPPDEKRMQEILSTPKSIDIRENTFNYIMFDVSYPLNKKTSFLLERKVLRDKFEQYKMIVFSYIKKNKLKEGVNWLNFLVRKKLALIRHK